MDSDQTHKRLLEALLFASPEPLPTRELHLRMPEGADVGGLLMELRSDYEGRGVELVEREGAWAFRTAPDLAESLTLQKEVARKLSRAAMETLAIVAYHQPITRAEIENIRGVATHKGTLDTLMEMGWIKPGRRRETPGRPLTWVSTTEFMDAFSLESLMDLPGMDDLKAAGLLDRRPAIEAIPQADLFSGQKRMDGVEGLSRAEDEDEDEESDPDFSDEVLNGHNTDEESGEEALEELI
ncbi:MAG: SMC-Scp complex subunit ScpB [Alphaproteobacteria bacterium]|nr:SMC-Scp complex subunit ScpB [Alphaproteobacteria bacterium]